MDILQSSVGYVPMTPEQQAEWDLAWPEKHRLREETEKRRQEEDMRSWRERDEVRKWEDGWCWQCSTNHKGLCGLQLELLQFKELMQRQKKRWQSEDAESEGAEGLGAAGASGAWTGTVTTAGAGTDTTIAAPIVMRQGELNALGVPQLRSLLLGFGLSDQGTIEKSEIHTRLLQSGRLTLTRDSQMMDLGALGEVAEGIEDDDLDVFLGFVQPEIYGDGGAPASSA
jgi:hypothetical protein